jgi:dipeptidase E
MGETREMRLREFLEENDKPVLGLREGTWLVVVGPKREAAGGEGADVLREILRVVLHGPSAARLFRRGDDPIECLPGPIPTPLLLPRVRD